MKNNNRFRGQQNQEWSRFLVIYDVEDNKVRTKIVKVLESYGVRVQRSAYECYADVRRVTDMKKKLSQLIDEGDSIRIYDIRDHCFDVLSNSESKTYSSGTIII